MRAAAIAIAVGAVLSAPAAAAAATPQEIRFHGGGYDSASVITTDASGNSYVGGYSESREGKDSFVVIKLGPDGAVRWTARYDGSRGGGGGQADAVAVDAAGNVYAAGFIHEGVIFKHELRLPRRQVRPGRDAALGAALQRSRQLRRLRAGDRRRRRGQRVRHRLLLRRGLRLRLGDAQVLAHRRPDLGAARERSRPVRRPRQRAGAAAGRQRHRVGRDPARRRAVPRQRRRDDRVRPAGDGRLERSLERHGDQPRVRVGPRRRRIRPDRDHGDDAGEHQPVRPAVPAHAALQRGRRAAPDDQDRRRIVGRRRGRRQLLRRGHLREWRLRPWRSSTPPARVCGRRR